jgi:ribosomal protein S12 methylthiotransferase accessory factor
VPPNWIEAVPHSDSWRAETATSLLARLTPALVAAGITRVAELTHLDRIGMPVFQAIRPMSRALSVHQGKGATTADARISAIMEGIESCAAETVEPNGPIAAFGELPPHERAASLASYGWARAPLDGFESRPCRWHAGFRIADGRQCYLPFDLVTQDFAADPDTPFVRSSNGTAAGASADDAITAAAFELVEREAQARWLVAGMVGQASSCVDQQTIEAAWFGRLRAHLSAIGTKLTVYALTGPGGLPVVICRIDEPGRAPSAAGAACRSDPDDALLRAFGEAAQSRLTLISGARDDIAADEPHAIGIRALGPPADVVPVDWRRFVDQCRQHTGPSPIDGLVADGYDVVRVDLPAPVHGVFVVKLVALGLKWTPEMLR